MSPSKLSTAAFLSMALLAFSCKQTENSDLVLRNGKVATVDENFSIQEAIAVKDDKIVFVGSDEDVASFVGQSTQVIDLDGQFVLPGLIDGHAHMHNLGEELMNLDIYGATSFQQIVDKVAEKAQTVEPGEWIIGGRWDQNNWEVKEFPEHDALSAVSPDNPVYLRRVDGNSAFVNQKGLDIAGITRDTPDPFGGVIHRKK